jgi:hypothetical protein
MNHNSYYVSSAANPVELAELNVPFYSAFVQEMGCNRLYRNLWVGENLEAFIQNFRHYQPKTDVMKNRKANAVSQYEKFYQQLTGCKLN